MNQCPSPAGGPVSSCGFLSSRTQTCATPLCQSSTEGLLNVPSTVLRLGLTTHWKLENGETGPAMQAGKQGHRPPQHPSPCSA